MIFMAFLCYGHHLIRSKVLLASRLPAHPRSVSWFLRILVSIVRMGSASIPKIFEFSPLVSFGLLVFSCASVVNLCAVVRGLCNGSFSVVYSCGEWIRATKLHRVSSWHVTLFTGSKGIPGMAPWATRGGGSEMWWRWCRRQHISWFYFIDQPDERMSIRKQRRYVNDNSWGCRVTASRT